MGVGASSERMKRDLWHLCLNRTADFESRFLFAGNLPGRTSEDLGSAAVVETNPDRTHATKTQARWRAGLKVSRDGSEIIAQKLIDTTARSIIAQCAS